MLAEAIYKYQMLTNIRQSRPAAGPIHCEPWAVHIIPYTCSYSVSFCIVITVFCLYVLTGPNQRALSVPDWICLAKQHKRQDVTREC